MKEEKSEYQKRFETLTAKEKRYFTAMLPKSGVLFISSKPGIAKSAISKSIAKKMGYKHIDIRLSMIDETDVGLYPNVSTISMGGKDIKVLDFVVPRWAVEACAEPTIIHFEEMNRAPQQVRNAVLQLLLERAIGHNFEFNDNVLMMCSGNLGDEDGTDVEEFDAALNNRLIHVKHDLSTNEWIKGYAEENVHSTIVAYMKAKPEQLYKKATENTPAYATPRSWTFLSDYIVANYGMKSAPGDWVSDVREVAPSYIGSSAIAFIRYCEDMSNLSIKNVIEDFESVRKKLEKYNRDRKSELLQSLKEYNLEKLTERELGNVAEFLKTIDDDEKTGYLLEVLDNKDGKYTMVPDSKGEQNFSKKITDFFLVFKDCLQKMDSIVDEGKNRKK
jgi:hypothetical protein